MHPLGHMVVSTGTVWIGARLASRSGLEARWRFDRIDYRLVLLGALLPDLIDKPIGWIIFRDYFDGNGHLYGHTLLAALVFIIPGLFLAVRQRDPRVLSIGIAMLGHLAVDPVNHSPETFLWPLLGTDFPKISLLRPTMTIVTETISALMLLACALWLLRSTKLRRVVMKGRID